MKVLVAGGAGYIGSHTVLALVEKGVDVVVIDSLEEGHIEAIKAIEAYTKKKITLIKVDLKDFDELNSIFDSQKDIDLVMNFAAYIQVGESVKDPLKYYYNNTYGTMNLLQAMLAHGVKKIVFSSTAAVYGTPDVELITEETPKKPINAYGMSKHMVENIMDDLHQSHGLNSIRLRYFNVVGSSSTGIIGEAHIPESHLVPCVLMAASGKSDKAKIFGDDYNTPDGTCIRDYIYIEDLVNAHILAMEKLMQEDSICDYFNLGSKNGYSVKEIIDGCQKVTGIDFPVEIVPRRGGDPDKLVADSTKAKEILGWEPKSDIRAMIKTAWKWMQEHPEGYVS